MIPYERKIRKWLSERDYRLFLTQKAAWHVSYDEKKIVGDPERMIWGPKDPVMKMKKDQALCVLLHECGHVERDHRGVARYVDAPQSADEKPPISWYLTMLHEEMDAWECAEEIAKSLGIYSKIKNTMSQMKDLCLVSYVAWCDARGDVSKFM